MNIHRALAIAVVAGLAAGPAFSADDNVVGVDEYYSHDKEGAQVRCYDLMQQFDETVAKIKKSKAVKEAKVLRMKGARQCDAGESFKNMLEGVKTLEKALKEIGQKPWL